MNGWLTALQHVLETAGSEVVLADDDEPVRSASASISDSKSSPGSTLSGAIVSPSPTSSSGAHGAFSSGAASDSPRKTSIVKEGYLQKVGGSNRSWKRRWFRLDADTRCLEYCKPSDKQVLGTIQLAGASVTLVSDDKFPGHMFLFAVQPRDVQRLYVIEASSSDERTSWMSALVPLTITKEDDERIVAHRGSISMTHGSASQTTHSSVSTPSSTAAASLSSTTATNNPDRQPNRIAPVTLQGVLKKQGGNVKSWHFRYFKLRASTLEYYTMDDQMESAAKLVGTIELDGCVLQSRDRMDDDAPESKRFLFTVTPVSSLRNKEARVYIFEASSEEERTAWVDSIRPFAEKKFKLDSASTREGWMKKLGGTFGSSWQDRFFVITAQPPVVKYFKTRADSEPAGVLDLAGATITAESTNAAKHEFTFSICPKGSKKVCPLHAALSHIRFLQTEVLASRRNRRGARRLDQQPQISCRQCLIVRHHTGAS